MAAWSPEEVDLLVAKAVSAGDVDAAVALYEADAVFVPPGHPWMRPVRGADAIAAALQEFVSMSPTLRLEPDKILKSGDLALVTGAWTVTLQTPDGEVTDNGVYTDVMRRQADGHWLFVIDNPDGISHP